MMSCIYAFEYELPHFWNSQPEAMPPSVKSYNSIQTVLTYNGTPAMSSIYNSTPMTSPYLISAMSTCSGTPMTSLYNVTSPMSTFNSTPMILLTLSTTTLTYYSTLTLSSSASLSNDA